MDSVDCNVEICVLVDRCSSVDSQHKVVHWSVASLPLNSPRRARNSFLSSSTRFLPCSMKASNLTVKSAIRFRKSSKLKSTVGNCVKGLSEYDMGAFCDCDPRKDEVLIEKAD